MSFGIGGVDRKCSAIGILRFIPFLLQAEKDAVVVMKFGETASESDGGTVVLLGLRPIAGTAIEFDQARMGEGKRLIVGQRGFEFRDRAVQVSIIREFPRPAKARR